MRVEFTANDQPVSVDVESRSSLLDVLRDDLRLTGTHVGCEHGVCGCCNVLVDGEVSRSCLMLAVQARGHSITTVEGLEGEDGNLSPLQEALCRHHAMQCGYCTPGILVGLTALLRDNPKATRDEIQESVSANLCRCTGYQQILDAVEELVNSDANATEDRDEHERQQ